MPVRKPDGPFLRGSADALPFPDESVDVVICNHTLEHFENVSASLREIGRVLKPGGALWAAVPDASTLDDRLYRYLFDGGGHVNRFSFDSFRDLVESEAEVQAESCKRLYTGFVYLNPPHPDRLPFYPRKAALLARVPPRLLRSIIRWLNFATRWCDRKLKRNWSLYGYAFSFRKEGKESAGSIKRLEEDHNVCFSCGSGHPTGTLQLRSKFRGLRRVYDCPACGEANFYTPTTGLTEPR